MLVDLDVPPVLPRGEEEWASFVATQWDRSRLVDPIISAARGFFLYHVASEARTSRALQWADLFQRSAGVQLESYFLGGLIALATELQKQPEEIARVFAPLPSRVVGDDGREIPNVPQGYYSLRCADLEQLRADAMQRERAGNPNEFDLITLLKYPLFRHAKGGAHSLFLSGIGVSLADGIYQEVMTASLERRIPETRQSVGEVFGYLFEDYVLDLLTESLGDPSRVLKRPRRKDNGNEAADGAILYPEGIIVLQIKGKHLRSTSRFAWKGPDVKEADVRKTGLVEAVDQFVEKESLAAFRNGLVDGLPFASLGDMVIQPVVVTYESVPLSGLVLPIVQKQRARVCLDVHTRPLVIINVSELEALCSLPGPGKSVWDVLTDFICSAGWQARHLYNFLHDIKCLRATAMLSRWDRIMTMLKSAFDLEA